MLRDGEAEANLRHIGAAPDAPFDLARAALALATFERPRVGLERYHRHLDELAGDVAAATVAATTPEARLEALNSTLIGAHGYSGDALNYDDMQNANLIRVIDRRKGLPVALGILYMHAGRAQGWPIEGLTVPGHFLLRLELGGERASSIPSTAARCMARASCASSWARWPAQAASSHRRTRPRYPTATCSCACRTTSSCACSRSAAQKRRSGFWRPCS